MVKAIRILFLRARRWWVALAVEIDEAAVAQHLPSLDRNRKRLQRIEFELDMEREPQALISRALKRRSA